MARRLYYGGAIKPLKFAAASVNLPAFRADVFFLEAGLVLETSTG